MNILDMHTLREFKCKNGCGLLVQTTNRATKYCKHCAAKLQAERSKAYEAKKRKKVAP